MSVDEVSWLKYHRYLTIVIDTDIKKVIWNAQGRKKEVLNRYYEALGPENCEKIESVAMDGARTYISSTEEYAKKALIVYDKFHVIQKLSGAVDATRRYELSKSTRRTKVRSDGDDGIQAAVHLAEKQSQSNGKAIRTLETVMRNQRAYFQGHASEGKLSGDLSSEHRSRRPEMSGSMA